MVIDKLNAILKDALIQCNFNVDDINIIKSHRPDLCDYQYDGAFKLASTVHKNPLEIAKKIVEELNLINDKLNYFSKIDYAPPGFVNLTLSDSFINNELKLMNDNPKFNIKTPKKVETFVLDYGGPNVAKPLHVGHLRTAIIGESVKRIINYVGHKTISDVHLGDFGLQIGQVIYGMINKNIPVEKLTLKDLNILYPEYSALSKDDENIKNECAKITKSIQDKEDKYQKYYEKIIEISIKDIKRIYDYLGVSFDYWYGEMSANAYLKDVEEILNNLQLLEKSEGALVVSVKEENDTKEVPPLIFKKSNGAYLYGSTDLATIYQREKDFKPDYIIYCTDQRQSLHFNQVFRVAKKANITDAKLEHIGYGTINGKDNKPYKTRNGKTPKLDDLFIEIKETFENIKETNKEMSEKDKDIIVNSIIKFADFQNNWEKDYIFDISKFSNVVGKTGPYILYTYLRINKIIKDENLAVTKISDNIYNTQDRDLRIKLLELPTIIQNAFINRMPSVIANYIYELCGVLNIFYQTNHIANLQNEKQKEDWLYILNLANMIIKEMLNLLIINIPSKM